jgi:hypothetical protein
LASSSRRSTSIPSPKVFRYDDEDSAGSTSGASWIISSRISSYARSLLGESIVSAKCTQCYFKMHAISFSVDSIMEQYRHLYFKMHAISFKMHAISNKYLTNKSYPKI